MDSKTHVKQKQTMLEFLDMYRDMPCLWDRKHPDYSVRRRRLDAYKALLHKYREVDEDATLSILKSRLDIMRNGFIRELKKVRLSKEMSSDPSQQYIPRLWYYDSISFLEDHYFPIKEAKTSNTLESHYDNDEENESNIEFDDSKPETVFLEENSNSSEDEAPLRKRRKVELAAKHERKEEEGLKQYSIAESEILGKAIAIQMRDLDPFQSAIAQKIISDTIYYAKLGKLSIDSHVITGDFRDSDPDEFPD